MARKLPSTTGLTVATLVVLTVGPAAAQTVANGPYYATPSWDQKLPVNTRFIVLANWNSEAVLDRETGLVWQRSPGLFQSPVTWPLAKDFCLDNNTGGRMGWRLPSIHELGSLIDPSVAGGNVPPLPPALPVGHPFTHVRTDFYWSITSFVGSSGSEVPELAWVVWLGSGGTTPHSRALSAQYWCVRGPMNADSY